MKKYNHIYQGYSSIKSECRVHIIKSEDKILIGFEDVGVGTSVTNVTETIATDIVVKENLDPTKCRFFEFYPQHEGTVHEIWYEWNESKASNPIWKFYCIAEDNPFL